LLVGTQDLCVQSNAAWPAFEMPRKGERRGAELDTVRFV
jgi:hypothetical protein